MKVVERWIPLMACVALATLISGCGGINASGSVSPASFLLPGILYKTPPAKAPAEVEKMEPGIVDIQMAPAASGASPLSGIVSGKDVSQL
jgi:hypothetical protein